jgi:hypothetical protein
MSSHVTAGTHRRCPVCQGLVNSDHDEALLINAIYDEGLVAVSEPVGFALAGEVRP